MNHCASAGGFKIQALVGQVVFKNLDLILSDGEIPDHIIAGLGVEGECIITCPTQKRVIPGATGNSVMAVIA